jgi:hypothetical protein
VLVLKKNGLVTQRHHLEKPNPISQLQAIAHLSKGLPLLILLVSPMTNMTLKGRKLEDVRP